MMIFTQILTALVFSKFPQWIRYGLYAFTNMLIVTGVMFLIYRYLPEKMSNFGIYLPLLAVNPVITRQCEIVAVESKFSGALKNAIASSLGYSIVALIVGAIRNLWVNGGYLSSNAAFMPFTGFIILAFLASILRIYFRRVDPEYAQELTVHSRSSLKSKVTERAKPTMEKIDENNVIKESGTNVIKESGTEDSYINIKKYENKGEKNENTKSNIYKGMRNSEGLSERRTGRNAKSIRRQRGKARRGYSRSESPQKGKNKKLFDASGNNSSQRNLHQKSKSQYQETDRGQIRKDQKLENRGSHDPKASDFKRSVDFSDEGIIGKTNTDRKDSK